jgi:hypothetical protein
MSLARWESYVLNKFRIVPKYHGGPTRTDFHGPYVNLLQFLFPFSGNGNYDVAARYEPTPPPSPYFRYEILFKNKPVMLLDIKGPGDLQYNSKRQGAIRHIQQRVKDLARQYHIVITLFHTTLTASDFILAECPLPVLHAVSAFGNRVCFCKVYRDQPRDIQPPFVPAPEGTMNLTPQEFWDYDVLEKEEETRKRFRSIAREIRRACRAL